jgi:hypothetical protein
MFRKLLFGIALLLSVVVAGSGTALATEVHAAPAAVHLSAPAASRAQLFDKTRVVLHLALAYGVFHHYVWKTWKSGDLSVRHPIKLIKAGAALLFSVHELKVAYGITSKSSSKSLKALNGVLTTIIAQFTHVGTQFKSPNGLTDAQVGNSVNGLNSLVNGSNKILSAPDASTLPSSF